MRLLGLALFLAACGGEAPAPSVPPVTTSTGAVTAYRDIRIIDGTGAAPIEHGTIVIEGKTIRAVGASAQIPAGAKIIDGTNLTVMPGLISNHSHVGMTDGTSGSDGHYTRENILRQLGQWEAYGVTTVTSLGLNGQLFYELQPALHRGELPGADLFGADRGIGVPGAAPPLDVGPDRLYRPINAEQARIAVRESAARHPSFIKLWVDDFNGSLKVKMAPETPGSRPFKPSTSPRSARRSYSERTIAACSRRESWRTSWSSAGTPTARSRQRTTSLRSGIAA